MIPNRTRVKGELVERATIVRGNDHYAQASLVRTIDPLTPHFLVGDVVPSWPVAKVRLADSATRLAEPLTIFNTYNQSLGGLLQHPAKSDPLEEQHRQRWECDCERMGHAVGRDGARGEPSRTRKSLHLM
jgi:hypothetical protein